MPLVRRVPKRGFTNEFRVEYVGGQRRHSSADLGATVTPELLAERGLVHKGRPVKVLGNGEITDRGHASRPTSSAQSARAKIEAAGGTCEEIG